MHRDARRCTCAQCAVAPRLQAGTERAPNPLAVTANLDSRIQRKMESTAQQALTQRSDAARSNVVSIGIVPAEKATWPRPVPATSTKEMQRRLGAAIRLRRRVIDITLTDLASACGVTFQQVQKYESGACSISAAQLWNIACALDIPIAQLYDCAAAAEVA